MASSKKRTKYSDLKLHELITALSFWGTTVRMLLVGFLAAVTFLIAVSQSASPMLDFGLFVYVMGALFIFDVGFVMLGRGLPLKPNVDRGMIILFEALLTAGYVIPYFAFAPVVFSSLVVWSLLIVIGLLSLRALLGLLYVRAS